MDFNKWYNPNDWVTYGGWEEAKKWFEAGFRSSKTALRWKARGWNLYSPNEAYSWYRDGWTDPEAALVWRNREEWRNDPSEALRWYSAGWDKPQEALIWRNTGWDNPQEAFQWLKAGWDNPQEAFQWLKAGWDDPQEAFQWLKAGWDNPQEAFQWKYVGWDDPQEALQWLKDGWDDPSEAIKWRYPTDEYDVEYEITSPYTALQLKEAGFEEPLDALEWEKVWGLHFIKQACQWYEEDQKEANKSLRLGPKIAYSYFDVGWPMDRAKLWFTTIRRNGSYANAWFTAGFTNVNVVSSWITAGCDIQTALQWKNAGQDAQTALQWKNAGWGSKPYLLTVALEWLIAGWGSYPPAVALQWLQASWGAQLALQWKNAGFTDPNRAAEWKKQFEKKDPKKVTDLTFIRLAASASGYYAKPIKFICLEVYGLRQHMISSVDAPHLIKYIDSINRYPISLSEILTEFLRYVNFKTKNLFISENTIYGYIEESINNLAKQKGYKKESKFWFKAPKELIIATKSQMIGTEGRSFKILKITSRNPLGDFALTAKDIKTFCKRASQYNVIYLIKNSDGTVESVIFVAFSKSCGMENFEIERSDQSQIKQSWSNYMSSVDRIYLILPNNAKIPREDVTKLNRVLITQKINLNLVHKSEVNKKLGSLEILEED